MSYLKENYENLGLIGEGAYGRVFKARHFATGDIVAIKRMNLGNVQEGIPPTALREISVLKSLNDGNIVRSQINSFSKFTIFVQTS